MWSESREEKSGKRSELKREGTREKRINV